MLISNRIEPVNHALLPPTIPALFPLGISSSASEF